MFATAGALCRVLLGRFSNSALPAHTFCLPALARAALYHRVRLPLSSWTVGFAVLSALYSILLPRLPAFMPLSTFLDICCAGRGGISSDGDIISIPAQAVLDMPVSPSPRAAPSLRSQRADICRASLRRFASNSFCLRSYFCWAFGGAGAKKKERRRRERDLLLRSSHNEEEDFSAVSLLCIWAGAGGAPALSRRAAARTAVSCGGGKTRCVP